MLETELRDRLNRLAGYADQTPPSAAPAFQPSLIGEPALVLLAAAATP